MATDNFARLQTEMGCLCRCSSGSRQTGNQQATKTPNEKTTELITRRGSAGRHSRSHPSGRTTEPLSYEPPACMNSGRSLPMVVPPPPLSLSAGRGARVICTNQEIHAGTSCCVPFILFLFFYFL